MISVMQKTWTESQNPVIYYITQNINLAKFGNLAVHLNRDMYYRSVNIKPQKECYLNKVCMCIVKTQIHSMIFTITSQNKGLV